MSGRCQSRSVIESIGEMGYYVPMYTHGLPIREFGIATGNINSFWFATIFDGEKLTHYELGNRTEIRALINSLSNEKHFTVLNTLNRSMKKRYSAFKNLTLVYAHTLDHRIDLAREAELGVNALREIVAEKYQDDPRVKMSIPSTASYEPTVEEPAQEQEVSGSVVLYTDASQSIENNGYAVYGWVREPDKAKTDTVEFNFGVTRRFESDHIEALAIVSAVVDNEGKESIVILSDSKHGADLARRVFNEVKDGGIITNKFISRYINRNTLKEILDKTTVSIRWVKGHSGNKWNDLVDHLVLSTRHDVDELFLHDDEELRDRASKRVSKWLRHNRRRS